MSKVALVLAPHPDDEVLGVGGTMARLVAEHCQVHVVTVTKGTPPLFSDEVVARSRDEALRAHDRLGVHCSHWLDLPAAELDTLPQRVLNERIGNIIAQVAPDELYIPFIGDIHADHQLVFGAALVGVRPHGRRFPAGVYAYETLSETNWNAAHLTPSFLPNHFVDISTFIDRKIEALRCFASQIRPAPHERSLEAVRALATLRGANVGVAAAEGFVTVRTVR